MTEYSLTCVNNSQLDGSFAIFQKAPPNSQTPIFSLAWLARPSAPGSQVTFTWTVDYSFCGAETGFLQPYINFSASQILPADPHGRNFVQATVDSDGLLKFAGLAATGAAGSLTIQQISNIVPVPVSIGIGMSGAPMFAAQFVPNTTTVFKPDPNYWVVFGNYTNGDVLDTENMTGAVQATYGGVLYIRTATLGFDNTITIT